MKYTSDMNEAVKECLDSGWRPDSEVVVAIIDELSRLQSERRWIPVSEKLPDHPNWVMAYNPIANQGDCCPAFYRDGQWYFELGEVWDYNLPISWRPLPTAPEEG
jgi:hypothetical protein